MECNIGTAGFDVIAIRVENGANIQIINPILIMQIK